MQSMMQVDRIAPEEARQKGTAGSAFFVCAYDDDEKFRTNHLEGAMSPAEFRSKLGSFPRDQDVIFDCA